MTDTENLSKYCGIRKSYLQNITNVWKTLENELRNISLNNRPPSSAAPEKGILVLHPTLQNSNCQKQKFKIRGKCCELAKVKF